LKQKRLIYLFGDDGKDSDWGHSAILDIGNVTGRSPYGGVCVIHMSNQGLETAPLENYLDDHPRTDAIMQIKDTAKADNRIDKFVKEYGSEYDPFFNNCEHFAYYVATGEKKSPTKRNIAANLALLGLTAWVIGQPLLDTVLGKKDRA
jgi:hypothetical protein